jgi:hypothetical protein
MVRGMESCPKIATRLRLLNVEAIHPHMLGISSYLEDHPTDRKWLIVSSPIYRWDDKSLNQKKIVHQVLSSFDSWNDPPSIGYSKYPNNVILIYFIPIKPI